MIYLNGVEITSMEFPNGELNLLAIEEAINARKRYRTNHFVMKYEDDKDLMALYFAKKQVDLRTSDISILSIAYMPYSRMDRAETIQTPFMLKFTCDFINSLDFSEVHVHEAHSAVTGQLLNNVTEVLDNIFFLEEVKKSECFRESVDYLVFPDKGAQERYDGKITAKNILVGEKKRDFSTGKILSLEVNGDFSNVTHDSTAIITDDLSSFGGTFIQVAKQLYDKGFERVVLLVCHAENSIFKGDLFKHVDKVYTTDSMLTEHTHWENQIYKPDKLQVFGMIQQMKEGNYK